MQQPTMAAALAGARPTWFFGLVVILGAALPAAPAQAQTRIGAIVGQVLDSRTEAPVSLATVTLAGTSHATSTDSTGSFRIQGLLAGRYTLEVRHIAYGPHSLAVDVEAGSPTTLRLVISQTAIALDPVTVEVLSNEELRARGAGFRRGLVTRDQIATTEGTNMMLPDVLRTFVPSVRIRRLERIAGAPVCIELRTIRSTLDGSCLSPVVYLDGTPVTDPMSLYATLDPRVIESMEVIPANEAGVRFGTGALYGALLIETRRPGVARGERLGDRPRTFDWSSEPRGHATKRAFVLSTAGNVAGLGLGTALARQCLRLRAPSYDGLISDCHAVPTLASAMAALLLPAFGSGLGSSLAGRTDLSQGQLMASTVGAAMVLVPGYALVMAGRRNDSDGLMAIGYVVVLAGTPLMSTTADYLFRKLRGRQDER